jgi:hypothetical protein
MEGAGSAWSEEFRTHHRRERQGQKAGHQNGSCDRHTELREQAADGPGQERDRHEDGDERERRREHGEGNLTTARECGAARRFSLLDAPMDILQHHDRIVDNKADRQDQSQESQDID